MSEDTFEGLGSLFPSTTTPQNGTLTLQDINNLLAWFKSDEYREQERQREERVFQGELLLDRAYRQGVITEGEFWYLMSTIEMNGGLVISPAMAERLKQVKKE